jgi:hypothetical protein
VQYIELGILIRGREARKRKESKEICSPILLLENGASAQEALTIAATVVDGGYLSVLTMCCLRLEGPPCFSAKAKKEGGRKE